MNILKIWAFLSFFLLSFGLAGCASDSNEPSEPSEECDISLGECEEEELPPDEEELCGGVALQDLTCLAVGVCDGVAPLCEGDDWVCSYPDGFEAEELSCDELDNDCDGFTDEADGLPDHDLHCGACNSPCLPDLEVCESDLCVPKSCVANQDCGGDTACLGGVCMSFELGESYVLESVYSIPGAAPAGIAKALEVLADPMSVGVNGTLSKIEQYLNMNPGDLSDGIVEQHVTQCFEKIAADEVPERLSALEALPTATETAMNDFRVESKLSVTLTLDVGVSAALEEWEAFTFYYRGGCADDAPLDDICAEHTHALTDAAFAGETLSASYSLSLTRAEVLGVNLKMASAEAPREVPIPIGALYALFLEDVVIPTLSGGESFSELLNWALPCALFSVEMDIIDGSEDGSYNVQDISISVETLTNLCLAALDETDTVLSNWTQEAVALAPSSYTSTGTCLPLQPDDSGALGSLPDGLWTGSLDRADLDLTLDMNGEFSGTLIP